MGLKDACAGARVALRRTAIAVVERGGVSTSLYELPHHAGWDALPQAKYNYRRRLDR